MRGSLLNRQPEIVGPFRVNSHEGRRVLNHNMNERENRKSKTFEENSTHISRERKYLFGHLDFAVHHDKCDTGPRRRWTGLAVERNTTVAPSEGEVQGQLQDSRLVARLQCRDLSEVAVAKLRIGIRQVGMVKDIQRLGSELQRAGFNNFEILQERYIGSR